jgi:hypothetical protein
MRWVLFAILATGLVAVSHTSFIRTSVAAPPLAESDVTRLRTIIRPTAGEDPFDTIPWETNLWAARKKAAAAGKPILLWEMDGHPLGCG